jgi:hypothetical protein
MSSSPTSVLTAYYSLQLPRHPLPITGKPKQVLHTETPKIFGKKILNENNLCYHAIRKAPGNQRKKYRGLNPERRMAALFYNRSGLNRCIFPAAKGSNILA